MKKIVGWIFTLWLPLIGIIWIALSLVFSNLGVNQSMVPEHLIRIKSMINWILGMLSLLSIVLFPIGIVLLCKGSKVGAYISYGWELAKKNFKHYRLPLVVILVVMITLTGLSETYGTIKLADGTETFNALGMGLAGINSIVGILYSIGLVKLGLQAGDEEKKFSIKTLFIHKWSEIWKAIIAPLLYGIIMFIPVLIMIGLLVFGILGTGINLKLDNFPAQAFKNISTQSVTISIIIMLLGLALMIYLIYIHLRISPVLKYAVIDHNNLSPWAMIKRSWKISKGKVWRLFSVGFVAGLINILGILSFGIGLLWTIPLTLIALAKVYKDIDTEYEKNNVN